VFNSLSLELARCERDMVRHLSVHLEGRVYLHRADEYVLVDAVRRVVVLTFSLRGLVDRGDRWFTPL